MPPAGGPARFHTTTAPGAATATGDALSEHVRGALRSSKTPDRILVWDELPRTETGKLIRREAVARIVDSRPTRV